MGFSVNTNVGAMAALQSLNATNKGLATTQSRINTGLSVASTKDDSAAYTVAQTLRGDLGGLTAVNSSLSRAKSTVDVATAGAEQISDLVNQMKAKATEASDAGLDADSRTALGKDFDALKSQISTIIDSSEFNGTNLLKASGGTVNALHDRAEYFFHTLMPPAVEVLPPPITMRDMNIKSDRAEAMKSVVMSRMVCNSRESRE